MKLSLELIHFGLGRNLCSLNKSLIMESWCSGLKELSLFNFFKMKLTMSVFFK